MNFETLGHSKRPEEKLCQASIQKGASKTIHETTSQKNNTDPGKMLGKLIWNLIDIALKNTYIITIAQSSFTVNRSSYSNVIPFLGKLQV